MKRLLHGAGLLLLGLAAPALYAQAPPIKWGDIPEEHLRMRVYPADTSAAAVILADYGTVRFEGLSDVVFKHHRRVKVLTEAGYDWGTVALPYYAEDHTQAVDDVKGQTVTIGPDGKVVRQALDRRSIFREDLDGSRKQVRFTLPGLQPGAVIEYQYTVRSNSPFYVPAWSFQHSEPVLWSEFRPEFPQRLGFVQAVRGVLRFHIEEQKQGLGTGGETTNLRLVMRDVPALREEPYMTTPENFRARLEYQLASYYDPMLNKQQKVLQEWSELATELMEGDFFGRQLDRPRRALRDQVAALTAGLSTPAEKLRAVYDYVRTGITWNGRMGIILVQDLDDVFTARQGSSPEVALLLVSLLREAGLEAHPVLISTRSHGAAVEQYPLLSQFNDVLVHVDDAGKTYLLDATDPVRPYDLLPFDALNGRGWLVRKDGARWIDIQASGRYAHQVGVEATLTAEGDLSAVLQASDDGYSALFKRRRLKEDGAEVLVRDVFLDGLADVRLDSHRVEQADSVMRPLRTTAAFTAPAYAQAAGDFLYVNPIVVDRVEENPLTLPERTFPVDFGYPGDQVYTLRLTLPEGYEVQELPAPLRVGLPSNGATFTRAIEVRDGVLTVQARFIRARSVFEPRQYQELRTFYERLVAAHAEQVVLKKTETTGGP